MGKFQAVMELYKNFIYLGMVNKVCESGRGNSQSQFLVHQALVANLSTQGTKGLKYPPPSKCNRAGISAEIIFLLRRYSHVHIIN